MPPSHMPARPIRARSRCKQAAKAVGHLHAVTRPDVTRQTWSRRRDSERRTGGIVRLSAVLLSRNVDECGEPLRFGGAGAPARRGDPVKTRPASPRGRPAGASISLTSASVGQPRQISVEHPGPQTHRPVRPFENVVHDREAMKVPVRQGEQDLEPVRLQGSGFRRTFLGHGERQFIPIGIYVRRLDGRLPEKV